MKIIRLAVILAVLSPFFSHAEPRYETSPITVEYEDVFTYWRATEKLSKRNIKVITASGMDCRAVVPPQFGERSEQFIDVEFTIDSRGMRYDQTIVNHQNVTESFNRLALRMGFAPGYRYAPIDRENRQPIISTERLYLIDYPEMCGG